MLNAWAKLKCRPYVNSVDVRPKYVQIDVRFTIAIEHESRCKMFIFVRHILTKCFILYLQFRWQLFYLVNMTNILYIVHEVV